MYSSRKRLSLPDLVQDDGHILKDIETPFDFFPLMRTSNISLASTSKSEQTQTSVRLRKESLSNFDPLLGAVLEPIKTSHCSLSPVSYVPQKSTSLNISSLNMYNISNPEETEVCVSSDLMSFTQREHTDANPAAFSTLSDEYCKVKRTSTLGESINLQAKESVVQHIRFLKDRLTFQDRQMSSLQHRENLLLQMLEHSHEMERTLIMKNNVLEYNCEEQRIELQACEETMLKIIDFRKHQKETHENDKIELAKIKMNISSQLECRESAFSELLIEYEKNKILINKYEERNETFPQVLGRYEARIIQLKEACTTLEVHANKQIEIARETIATEKNTLSLENAKIKAMLKKANLSIKSLEKRLENKMKENIELTSVFESLVKKAMPK